MTNDIEEMLFNDTILQHVVQELKQYKLSPKDYINIANQLLDVAINKPVQDQITPPAVISDKNIKLPIQFEDIVIREFDYNKDSVILNEWTQNNYGKEFLLSRIDDKENTVEDLLNDKLNLFGIIESVDKIPMGILGFLNIDKLNKKAELRKLIGNNDFRGKGYGKKATKVWISYGINTLKLRKIYIYTYDTNLRNIRINREVGFNLEGIFKAENISNGELQDIIRMALITK